MKSPVKFLFGLLLVSTTILCGCLDKSEAFILEGNYCTVRDGVTGLVSSEINISPDTIGVHDYIISNISGYPTPSDAYRNVPAYLVGNDILRIPEYEFIISNDSNLKIWGRGQFIDGSIKFEIHSQRDEEVIFELSAIDLNNSLNGKAFRSDSQEIKFSEGEMEVQITDNEDFEHAFKIPFEMTGCSVKDIELTVLNRFDSVEESLRISLFNSGDKLEGEMVFSRDGWNTESEVEFSLQKVN